MVRAISTDVIATPTISIDLISQVSDLFITVKFLFAITKQDLLSSANILQLQAVINDGKLVRGQHWFAVNSLNHT